MWEWEWPGLSTAREHRTFQCSSLLVERSDGAIVLAKTRKGEHRVKVIVVGSL